MALYLDDLKRISDQCLENGDKKISLIGCLEDKIQLWNIPSDGGWFGQLCRNTLREEAGRKQLKVVT